MGILSRFKDIMSSNINAMLDKAEDPEKMLDQCLRNLNSDLGKVKAETASIMANEQKAKRDLEECNDEMEKLQRYAVKAVEAGNDGDAKAFLAKKQNLATKQADLQAAYETAKTNSANMKAMHDKLTKDITAMEQRRDTLKAKLNVAKTQQHINEMVSSAGQGNDSIDAFDRMEDKVNHLLDQANATASLNAQENDSDGTQALMDKYDDSAADSTSVDDELAALKASLNQAQ